MLVFILLLSLLNQKSASAYDLKDLYSNDKLNVHIVPHTHDDPGWLKTADQYYYGSNTTIYNAGVQYVLDTVVENLETDEKKQFVYGIISIK